MKTFARAALLAMAVALALSTTAEAAPKLTKQKFAVTFKGEHGQDWVVRLTDAEFEPNCTIGPGAYGSSQLDAQTRKTQVVTFLANRRAGTALGSAPVDAFLNRTFALGSTPPDDCRDVSYERWSGESCSDAPAAWSYWPHSPPADVAITAARGRIAVEVRRAEKERLLEELFPLCPFAGVEEGKIEGTTKLAKAKLFSGKAQTVKYSARHDYPAPKDHEVEGLYEWTLTIKAIKPKKRR
jgi:hypothetical protein